MKEVGGRGGEKGTNLRDCRGDCESPGRSCTGAVKEFTVELRLTLVWPLGSEAKMEGMLADSQVGFGR